MSKIGILGGSFDPVHLGHLSLAQDAREQAGLDELWLMPAKIQPFKQDRQVTEEEHRLQMLRAAVSGTEGLKISTLEMELEGVSYTYRTLREVRRRFAEKGEEDLSLFFVTGADTFVKMDSWMHAEELLRENDILVGSRPGYLEEETARCMALFEREYGTKITKIRNEQIDISSTEIQRRCRRGESISGLVPRVVEDYIREHALYRKTDDKAIDLYLRQELTDKRIRHTEGVVKAAEDLARRYGADEEKARIAAKCHDLCRKWDDERMNSFIALNGLDPERYLNNINLSHSKAAVELARLAFDIREEDILNAISYHTTGRAGMSLLEKILYLADAIEEGRDYPGVEELRQLAREDLDAALLMSLERSKAYVEEKGEALDPDTEEAIAWLQAERSGQESEATETTTQAKSAPR